MEAMESCQRASESQHNESDDERRNRLLPGGGDLGQGHRQQEQKDEDSEEAIHEAEESKHPLLNPGVTF